ncbi:hypothetical protein GCM10010464_29450 [Pseudonocardia yunnanensis]|uniref:hypothetical protein n=1 Tax=Pseudonocardia yunnanensis TaxID=58107 RepID=UPI00338C90F4
MTVAGAKRVSLAVLVCIKPGQRPRLIYRTHVDRGRRTDYVMQVAPGLSATHFRPRLSSRVGPRG